MITICLSIHRKAVSSAHECRQPFGVFFTLKTLLVCEIISVNNLVITVKS